jgi:hypothetical protein
VFTLKLIKSCRGQGAGAAALHHTEIVYWSAAQIRQELLDRGVPEALLDDPPKDANDK